ncbi:hypothetical protein [Pseudodesulfovibrio sediminis]|uniref:Uncharacterized protein n=1 Tax=Pseudodesulfovibrio sediminis TaxID=2810563 RepID=A0ABM7P927_9BACT|nr:hypothetical protein [Pseudodesulfovibrio sediminis]BCS89496.1 hypothetical protein PSDVSF_27380 [Pseudodesulfovibrio sediminis]
MKDERGHYYTPVLQHPEVRMYVREEDDQIQFRLYNPTEPIIWEKHGWMPFDVIEQAAAMFREKGTDRNPMALYDLDIAKKLLTEG